jgi:hypothetical protein
MKRREFINQMRRIGICAQLRDRPETAPQTAGHFTTPARTWSAFSVTITELSLSKRIRV